VRRSSKPVIHAFTALLRFAFCGHSAHERFGAIQLAFTLVGNILKHPGDRAFRRYDMGNKLATSSLAFASTRLLTFDCRFGCVRGAVQRTWLDPGADGSF
jgi:hypothetical protein